MNLLLLFDQDFIDSKTVVISDRRKQHIDHIHDAQVGNQLSVGIVNGNIGKGLITKKDNEQITLSIYVDTPPPKPLPLTLIIALPRPKMLRRILQTCATMGAKDIIFINSYRVEKSYWSSPFLQQNAIEEQLILGLEQGKDTLLPEVHFEKRFKPFVEDHLPTMCENTQALVAHPVSHIICPNNIDSQTTLVIGPEGGFIEYEIEKLKEAGCVPVHIGERILRVETAVTVLLSRFL